MKSASGCTLRSGGKLLSTLIGLPDQLSTADAAVIGIYANPDPATLDRLATNHASNATQVTIQGTFGLEQAPDAFAAFGSGTLGKITITTC